MDLAPFLNGGQWMIVCHDDDLDVVRHLVHAAGATAALPITPNWFAQRGWISVIDPTDPNGSRYDLQLT